MNPKNTDKLVQIEFSACLLFGRKPARQFAHESRYFVNGAYKEVKHNGSELIYGYDAAGNRTTLTTVVAGTTNTYNYDSQNRLIEANMGGVVQSMIYDPDDVRFGKSINGVRY